MKIRRIIFATALVLIGTLVFVTPAVAIGEPDSAPYVENLRVYRHVLEDDDFLIVGEYVIPYATVPDDVRAGEAYMFRLLDGATEIGAVTPYEYFYYGYNEGVFSFYFSADDAPAWGSPYVIRISQNPVNFATPDSWDYDLIEATYSTAATQELMRIELQANIIDIAQRMEVIYYPYVLTESGVVGTVLAAPTGETYFRGVIYGVQAMCPDLFLLQVLTDVYTEREWTTDQADEYGNRWAGTWVDTDIEETADQFGMTTTAIMALIFAFPVCLGSVIVSAKKFGKAEPGYIICALVVLVAFIMGWMPPAIFATIYQIAGIYLGYVWFYSRG